MLQHVDQSIAGAVAIEPELVERNVMLKYSITALALVAGSTFALADPNPGGANGPGSSSGAAMEHSGVGMSGGAKESSAGKDLGGSQLKGDRSSAGDSGARP